MGVYRGWSTRDSCRSKSEFWLVDIKKEKGKNVISAIAGLYG
jgi:hypothetical protein